MSTAPVDVPNKTQVLEASIFDYLVEEARNDESLHWIPIDADTEARWGTCEDYFDSIDNALDGKTGVKKEIAKRMNFPTVLESLNCMDIHTRLYSVKNIAEAVVRLAVAETRIKNLMDVDDESFESAAKAHAKSLWRKHSATTVAPLLRKFEYQKTLEDLGLLGILQFFGLEGKAITLVSFKERADEIEKPVEGLENLAYKRNHNPLAFEN